MGVVRNARIRRNVLRPSSDSDDPSRRNRIGADEELQSSEDGGLRRLNGDQMASILQHDALPDTGEYPFV
jgi:hypothetical protein